MVGSAVSSHTRVLVFYIVRVILSEVCVMWSLRLGAGTAETARVAEVAWKSS